MPLTKRDVNFNVDKDVLDSRSRKKKKRQDTNQRNLRSNRKKIDLKKSTDDHSLFEESLKHQQSDSTYENNTTNEDNQPSNMPSPNQRNLV